MTLWIAALHVVYLLHAGPLWRDEAGTVDFAAMSSIGEIWRNLRYDNFPPLFVGIARIWTLAGLGSDFGYRLLGFLIGIGTLAVLWYCARKLGGSTPLLVLALYAANPLAIRVGDSIRPYGLGIALMLLTAALTWNFVKDPRGRTLFWAALAATLSVQCLYQNAFFIIAFSCGAWVVTLGRKEWRAAWQTGIIGLTAAVSLLPYYGNIVKGQEWFDIERQEVLLRAIGATFARALQYSGGWMPQLWMILFVASLGAAFYLGAGQLRWHIIYCGTVLVVSGSLYAVFLVNLGLVPHSWYFLILLAPATLMMDSILAGMIAMGLQMGRAVLAVTVFLASVQACYAGVLVRQTNVDLVAAKLKEAAQPGDLILVSPWYVGVSLQRYLNANRWTTLPPMEEIRIHRYDLIKRAMKSENPIGPSLDQVRTTLRSGHRVWVVGILHYPVGNGPPPAYPPYDGNMEGADAAYLGNWTDQLSYLARDHAVRRDPVKVPVPGDLAVNPLEDVPLLVVQGWRE